MVSHLVVNQRAPLVQIIYHCLKQNQDATIWLKVHVFYGPNLFVIATSFPLLWHPGQMARHIFQLKIKQLEISKFAHFGGKPHKNANQHERD